MKLNRIFLFTTFFSCGLLFAQDQKLRKAEASFQDLAYADAIDQYEDLLDEGYQSKEIFQNLADAYYKVANFDEAAKWYEKLFALNEEVQPETYFRYAQVLKSQEKYTASDQYMKQFYQLQKDSRGQLFSENENYLEGIAANSGRYTVNSIAGNSENSDFGPSFYNNTLVFTSARGKRVSKRNRHNWDNKPFLELYRATISDYDSLSEIKRFRNSLSSKFHESTTAFTKDGQTIYFTRNNFTDGKLGKDSDDVIRLKLYKATKIDEKWSEVEELPFNSDEFSVAHPALNAEEDKLYFASDMPGTKGQSDIFVVDIYEDGTYGQPQNLAGGVNTEGRETFPFVSADGILYFASDGHPGLGGLDIFATALEDTNYVLNVGKPVNSPKDDFSYIVNAETRRGYFASNRDGGMGDDDIYAFKEEKPLSFGCDGEVRVLVKDSESGLPLANAAIMVKASNGDRLEGKTDDKGMYQLQLDCRKKTNLAISGSKEAYTKTNRSVSIDTTNPEATVELLMKPKVQVGSDLAVELKLNPIYFDLNKATIRPDAAAELDKVVAYLKAYPSVQIEVGSHTDSRGSDNYNLKLSERRAQSTAAYIIKKGGIDASRVSGKGYGETRLRNACSNGVKCSKDEHQNNRRSEFIVLNK